MRDFELKYCLCGEYAEVFNIDNFWVVGCSNPDCDLYYKNSKYRYVDKEIAIEDWNNRINSLKEKNFEPLGV